MRPFFIVRAALILALWTPLVLFARTSPAHHEDSVAFHPKSNLYFIYQRDSLLSWHLTEVLDREGFLRYREGKLLGSAPPGEKYPVSEAVTPKRSGGLTFDVTGDASLQIGGTLIQDDAPQLPAAMRRRSFADILYETNIAVRAGYGDHLKLDLHYNTRSSFAQNRQMLRLSYVGDRFDPIEKIQAGDIAFVSENPLVSTGSSLFGLRTDFRLGRLHLTALASRRHDMERKVILKPGGGALQTFESKSSEYQFARHFFLLQSFADAYDDRLSELPIVRSGLHIDRLEVWVTNDRGRVADPSSVPVSVSPSWALTGERPDDFERLPSASRLPEGAYYFNPDLGFLSLKAPLTPKQRLAVAFSYTLDGVRHQVGTFVSEGSEVFLALLSDEQKIPSDPLWPLMMKNGYNLPFLTDEGFTLEIYYRDPATGIEQPANADGTPWLRLFGLDRSNASGDGTLSDGLVDEIPGVLFLPDGGTLFLPRRYPFESVPEDEGMKYPDLYRSTPYEAAKETALDRFIIRGTAEGGSALRGGGAVSLGASGLEPGSVTVRDRSGRQYMEGTDFDVDYEAGMLTFHTDASEEVEVTIRERELARQKEKNLMGLEAAYRLLPSLTVGGSLMHYSEVSPLERFRLGEEPIKNTLWGFFLKYSDTYPALTAFLDELLPGDLTAESTLSLGLAYARLHSGYNGVESVALEDFDEPGRTIGLTFPSGWHLSSNPFPDLAASDAHRGLLSWFSIDPLFTRKGATDPAVSLPGGEMEAADPLVREVLAQELFPGRDQDLLGQMILPALNLSFYPDERGPFMQDLSLLDSRGHYLSPAESWGAIAFPLLINDFQSEQVTYLEGWFLDPFADNAGASSGTIYFDLGRISEDVIPDGRAGFESAYSEDAETPLARVPDRVPQSYGFDRTGAVSVRLQDKGLDGMTDDLELARFGNDDRWLGDPSMDNYRFFLDPYYDQKGAGIIERYKYINGTEGNAVSRIIGGREAAAGWDPDREDLDGNFILDTEEHFFRYRLSLSPLSSEHIIGERTYDAAMPDGSVRRVRWLKFRIPLSAPFAVYGSPIWQDIRSLRLSLNGFTEAVHLRFTELRLVSSSWQVYDLPLDEGDKRAASASYARLSAEEDAGRSPVPYVSPPSVARNVTPSGTAALLRADEQSAVLTFSDLEQGQGVALFHTTAPWDLRRYRELSLFVHLESGDKLLPGDLELFIRLGSDFSANYYEVTLPLTATPLADYSDLSSAALAKLVWPDENRLKLDLASLVDLKARRDEEGVSSQQLYEDGRRLFVRGFPTLADVSSILIGVRSRRTGLSSGEVWFDELEVSGSRDMGGDAFLASGDLRLSDLLRLQASGGHTSAGFGSVSQDARLSSLEDLSHFALRTDLNLDKFLPDHFASHLPLSFSWKQSLSTPLYSPVATDRLFDESIDGTEGRTKLSEYRLLLDDWRLLKSKPRFYDPATLSFTYDLRGSREQSPQFPSRILRQMHALFAYDYRLSPDDYIRLSSEWDRLYHKSLLPSLSSSLQSQWLWNRLLQLKLTPIPEIALSLTGSTTALIEEPFEAAHLRDEKDDFRLFTRDILHSIALLGTVQGYSGNGSAVLKLPHFDHPKLSSLSASLMYDNDFRWDSGFTTLDRFMGNEVTSKQTLDGRLSYDFKDLFKKESTYTPLGTLFVHGRHSSGGSLPGLTLEAGKAFGVPGLYLYQWGLLSHTSAIDKAFDKGWILSSEEAGRRIVPSYYGRNEFEGSLTLTPLKGLELRLSFAYRSESHTSMDSSSGGILMRDKSLRMSTIGLKGLFSSRFDAENHASALFERFRNEAQKRPDIPAAFLKTFTASGASTGKRGLTSPAFLLPNWSLSYDLTSSLPLLKDYLSSLRLQHHYNGLLDIPLYTELSTSESGQGYRTMTQTDDLSPLIGVDLTTRFGLSVKEHYNRRRSLTLLITSLRLLEQQDHELSTYISYSKSFPALFTLPFPLFRDADHTVTAAINHLYTRSYLLTRLAESGESSATQGLDTRRLRVSLDYAFSKGLTVRAFYDLTQRRPLVTLYEYPFRQTSYGLLFLLRLQ